MPDKHWEVELLRSWNPNYIKTLKLPECMGQKKKSIQLHLQILQLFTLYAITTSFLSAVQHERGPRKSKNKSNTDHHSHHHHHQQTNTPSASNMASHQTPTPMIPMLGGVTIEGPIDLRVQPPPAKSETLNMSNMSVGKNQS